MNTVKGKKLEFGNDEQIKFLQKHRAYEKQMINGLVDFEHERTNLSDANIDCQFICAECGTEIRTSIYCTVEYRQLSGFMLQPEESTKVKCVNCLCTYQIYDGQIWLIHNPKYPEKTTNRKSEEVEL
ncbi:hypothetical protein BDE36_1798 [Arcticibacter tournemirensis]|nr:hypothetical protein BDE36_1798 [Arcticibacter tournemirensis]